jgi:hypothetical protein
MNLRLAAALAMIAGLAACTGQIQRDPHALGTGDLRLREPAAADRPILLTITIHNTGEKPLTYFQPDLMSNYFAATLTPAGLPPRTVPLDRNGPAARGARSMRPIPPDGTLELPIILPPQPAGTYRLSLESTRWTLTTPPCDFTLPTDPAAAKAFDEIWLQRILTGDLQATQAAESYPAQAPTAQLIARIKSPDAASATRAVDVVRRQRQWIFEDNSLKLSSYPPDAIEACLVAIQQQLAAPEVDPRFIESLAGFVETANSDAASGALIPLIRRLPPGDIRLFVVRTLHSSRAPEVVAALHQFLQDPDPATRLGAAQALTRQHDLAAVPALVELSVSFTGRQGEALFDLASFPESPQAVAAIKARLDDPVQKENARRAWNHLQDVKQPARL